MKILLVAKESKQSNALMEFLAGCVPNVEHVQTISQALCFSLCYKTMNLPHFFTLLRIFISPLFPLLYFKYESLGISFIALPYVLLSLLIVCECSDLFDGFLASFLFSVSFPSPSFFSSFSAIIIIPPCPLLP